MMNNTAALRNDRDLSSPRNEVIEKSLPLVKSLTARLRRSHGQSASFDDLYEAGIDGLMQAAERFDPANGTSFTTFAYYRIRGSILDSLRRGPQSKRTDHARTEANVTVHLSAQAVAANDNARGGDGADPSPERLSWQLSESVLAQLVLTDDVGSLPDESALDPDDGIERQRLAARVASALSALPEAERRVVELHYYEDLSFAEIGQKLGICKPWAFRLHNRALRRLRGELAELAHDDGDDDDVLGNS
jgi:RNA polymerase sigma factor for flagellar operon FliA